jgi:hypothetical protein
MLAGDGNEARAPDGFTRLRANERIEDELGAVWQDARAPALGKLAQASKALERASIRSADSIPGRRDLSRVPLHHDRASASSKIDELT